MKKNGAFLTCKTCNSKYYVSKTRLNTSNFCSNICKSKGDSKRLRGTTPDAFKREAYGEHSRLSEAKKCGHLTRKGRSYCFKCRQEKMGGVILFCKECGKSFTTRKSAKNKYKCCSMLCRNAQISKRQKGPLSHLWKGGLTSENRKLRNSREAKLWRNAVFKRDDFTCQICLKRGGKLTADHINAWSLYPMIRFELSNGRTLCVDCHKKTDNFSGRAYQSIVAISDHNKSFQYGLL